MLNSRFIVAALSLAAAACLAMTVALALLSNRPPDHFARDPLAVMDGPFYVGLLSNITAAVWFAAAGGALVIASATGGSGRVDSLPNRGRAMAAIAAFIAWLGVDDLFMLHEEVLQHRLGVPEIFTIACYGMAAAGIAIMFRRALQDSAWSMLLGAGAFFAASLGVDFFTTGFGWRPVIEDSLKFLGVVGLLAYVTLTARMWLRPRDVV